MLAIEVTIDKLTNRALRTSNKKQGTEDRDRQMFETNLECDTQKGCLVHGIMVEMHKWMHAMKYCNISHLAAACN